MSSKVVTGLVAGAGSFIGLVLGSAVGQVFSKSAATQEQGTATLVFGGLTGMVLGAFSGAALVANATGSSATGVAGLPKGLGAAPPHKCTAQSATGIAQQLPGAPWRYTGSLQRGCPLPFATTTQNYNVVTPEGPKSIPVRFSADGRMVLTCPHTGEAFVFARGSALAA